MQALYTTNLTMFQTKFKVFNRACMATTGVIQGT